MKNQTEREQLKAQDIIPLSRYGALKTDMDKSLRPAAQALLRRRTDRRRDGHSV